MSQLKKVDNTIKNKYLISIIVVRRFNLLYIYICYIYLSPIHRLATPAPNRNPIIYMYLVLLAKSLFLRYIIHVYIYIYIYYIGSWSRHDSYSSSSCRTWRACADNDNGSVLTTTCCSVFLLLLLSSSSQIIHLLRCRCGAE